MIIDCNFTLSNKKQADSWFLTHSGDIVLMKYATMNDCKSIIFYGTALKSKTIFFFFPISSKHSDMNQMEKRMQTFVNLIYDQSKIDQAYVFIPLLHTLK